MLAQADFQRALALALGEFAEAWAIVGECVPVDRFDASHWGSGPQSFQVTLRHRVTGHQKVLGRRVAYEPGASLHPAVALSLIGAYRHGNPEPIRRYFEEIGIASAATAPEGASFFRQPSTAAAARTSDRAPTEAHSATLAVAAIASGPRAGYSPTTSTTRSPAPAQQAPAEIAPVRVPVIRRSMPTAEPRQPMLGRLKRELKIWYWRRGAGSPLDKEPRHARD